MTPGEKNEYDLRYRSFLLQMVNMGRLYPREKYLYRIMKRVPFGDLETDLAMAALEYAREAGGGDGE